MIRHLLALTALCFLFTAAPARAQDETAATNVIGAIIAIEGPVTIADQPAAADSAVHRGDVITTGDNARALILLKDDSQFTLGANASFSADDYVFDQSAPAANRARYNVARGAFLYASGLISKSRRPDVRIETAYASIGIRGTIVWGGAIDNGYGVLVQEGEVSVETDQGSLRVRPSEGTMVSGRNALPVSPIAWPQEKIDRAVATISFTDQAAADARLKERKDSQQAARYKKVP